MLSNISDHKILDTIEGSPAKIAGIKAGDFLVSINNNPLKDIFDYYYFTEEESFVLLIRHEDGSYEEYEIEKDADEDLGLSFESALLSDYKRCNNNCIFCFIDQMPPGMRDTLYFKDDDTRLSFLQGNYVTLTNISDEDLNRIIDYRLAPINISVHATDPEIRVRMLKNRFAGDILEKIEKIADAKLPMNAQIVLCKGINDGDVLKKSMEDLSRFIPYLNSVSVVPVGLTKYRQGLFDLESFNKEDAVEVLDIIESFATKCKKKHGINFIYPSDEWYVIAGKKLPKEEEYDGYPQLENGVGMLRLLITEFREALKFEKKHLFMGRRSLSIACGAIAHPYLRKLCDDLIKRFPKIKINIYKIKNEFFGEKVTVSGLVTGGDLIKQLKGKELGESLLIPIHMLRSGEEVFLDDVSVSNVERELSVKVRIVEAAGEDLLDAIMGR